MARTKKPESAAKEILDMVLSGQATSAADAVQQRPSLQPGINFLKHTLLELPKDPAVKPNPGESPTSSPTKARGSGPALLSRD